VIARFVEVLLIEALRATPQPDAAGRLPSSTELLVGRTRDRLRW
jgi:hypothetical protein